jgi:Zn-dependent protease with chaperone function
MVLPASAVAIWAFIPLGAASFNLFDRVINLRADAHAVAVTGDPEALCRWLVKDSPGADPDPNVLDRVFFYDHPPLRPRLLHVFAQRIPSGLNETFASAR